MVVFYLLLIILPLFSSSLIDNCPPDGCPSWSKCALDSSGNPSCLCDEGFTGTRCEIVTCNEFTCAGPLSICENTVQGPICHCEEGREGDNCQLLRGETRPWSRCANAAFCENSFQNGQCDEICNNPECFYDGYDCSDEESSEELAPTYSLSLLVVRVDVTPLHFFTNRLEFLSQISAPLNKNVTVARLNGYDHIFVVDDESHTRAAMTEEEAIKSNATFVEIELAVENCNFEKENCDEIIEDLKEMIEKNDFPDLLFESSPRIIHPSPDSSQSSSLFTPIIIVLLSLLLICIAILIAIIRRSPKKRFRTLEAPIYRIPTLSPSSRVPDFNRRRTEALSLGSEGGTLLHQLAELPYDAMCPIQAGNQALHLISSEIDVNKQDYAGDTALNIAIRECRMRIVRALLTNGNADPTIVNNLEQTPIHIAAANNDCYALDLLLAHPLCKETLNMTDIYNRTPLVSSIIGDPSDTQFAQKLLIAGADPNYVGDMTYIEKAHGDRTALHYAAELGMPKHIQLLLEYGANVNAHDGMRRTPLHYAVHNCKINAVKLLVNRGAEKFVHDETNETPIDVARRMKWKEILEFLQTDCLPTAEPRENRKRGKRRGKDEMEKKRRRSSTDTGYQSESPLNEIDDDVTEAAMVQSQMVPSHSFPAPPPFPIPATPQLTPAFPQVEMENVYEFMSPRYPSAPLIYPEYS